MTIASLRRSWRVVAVHARWGYHPRTFRSSPSVSPALRGPSEGCGAGLGLFAARLSRRFLRTGGCCIECIEMTKQPPASPTTITEAVGHLNATGEGCLLRVIDGPDVGVELDLADGSIVVGSGSGCGLRLSDPAVSREHARVEVVAEGLSVTDTGSTNGTYYLETRIERAVVPHGATLRLGRTRLHLASRKQSAGPDFSPRGSYGDICGSAPAMQNLYAVLERIEAFPDYTVLIQGESGVGKELVAREIHRHSARASGPFEICDCTAFAPTLAESELFGHVRGAFTGAQNDYEGAFGRSDGGSIFLDEIGELSPDLQPKLLRVLQNHEIRPVGAPRSRSVNTRVIAATNRNLGEELRDGRFREDLYFRLKMVVVDVPPLRRRREDIPMLVECLLAELAPGPIALSPLTMELLTTGYDWPGNVRELRHAIASTLAMGHLPEGIAGASPSEQGQRSEKASKSTFQDAKQRVVEAFERDYLRVQLEKTCGNISQAARLSNVDRNYFKQLLRKHNLLAKTGDAD